MDEKTLKNWQTLIPSLSEAQKRWYVGLKAIELGRGGIARMHELTGLSKNTIVRGIHEVKQRKPEKMGFSLPLSRHTQQNYQSGP